MPQIKKVENTWTQVPNTWLKDKNLSLKAKGLLTVMQSLPDNWEFSIRGLASILKEGVEAIQSALQEIENAGYLTRTPTRDEKGFFSKADYVLHENPRTENQYTEKPAQYNTKIQNTKKERDSDSADASSDTSPFVFPASNNNEKVVSRQADNRKREFALCSDLLALMRLGNVKPGVKLRNAIRARLKEGYSEVDLRAIARWSATQQDEFYKVPHSLFSEAGVAGAMSLMKKVKNGTTYSTR